MHARGGTEGDTLDALTVRAHRDFAELAGFEAELERLNVSSRRPTLFLTLAFLRTAWEHEEYVYEGRRPLLLTAWEGEHLIGFLPLRTATERAFGLPCKVVELLITHDQDRPFVVAAPEDEARCAAAFYRYLLEREPRWSALRFMAQDSSSALFPPPIPLSRLRYQVRLTPYFENATIPLRARSLHEHLGMLGSESRKTYARQAKKLLAAGKVGWVGSSDPRGARALLDVYIELERHNWKARADGNVARSAARVDLFRALMQPGHPFAMRVDLLTLDDVPIAGQIGGLYQRVLYCKEITHDSAYRALSPGNTLMQITIALAIREGAHAYNLMNGFGYYKRRWGGEVVPTRTVEILRIGTPLQLRLLLRDVRSRFREKAPHQTEVDYNLARRALVDADEGGPEERAPDRSAERAALRAALRQLRAEGVPHDDVSGDTLATTLGLKTASAVARAS